MGLVPGDEPVRETSYIGHVGRLREACLVLQTAHDRAQPRRVPMRLHEQRARDELRRVVAVERGLEVLSTVAISGNQWQSVAISGNQWQSELEVLSTCGESIERSHQWANSGNHHLEALSIGPLISGHQWSSVVISGHQWSSPGGSLDRPAPTRRVPAQPRAARPTRAP